VDQKESRKGKTGEVILKPEFNVIVLVMADP